MSCAEEDRSFPAESRRRAEDILAQRKQPYHIVVFQGVKHGFATRGDPEDPTVRECLMSPLLVYCAQPISSKVGRKKSPPEGLSPGLRDFLFEPSNSFREQCTNRSIRRLKINKVASTSRFRVPLTVHQRHLFKIYAMQ